MLVEELLYEKLGNLRKLNVGSMWNIMKQRTFPGNKSSGRRGTGPSVSPTGNVFGGSKEYYERNAGFGDNSEIVDVGVIKNGIGGLRKAYKEHDSAIGFAMYVNGKAVAFGKFSKEDLAGSSRLGIVAFDLSQFQDKFDREHQAKMNARSDYDKKHDYRTPQKRETSSYSKKVHDEHSYEARRAKEKGVTLKPDEFHGKLHTTADLKDFLEELTELAHTHGKSITCKLVLRDTTADQKRSARFQARMSSTELKDGLTALKLRLAKYKNSRKPTADNIEEFMGHVLKKSVKVIQFGGRSWSTMENGSDKIDPVNILNGHTFNVRYSTADPEKYDTLDVTYKFDRSTNTLEPFKAKWSDKNHQSQEAALKVDTYLKHELKIDKVDKDVVIKAILQKLKDGNHQTVKSLIAASRKGGNDYPEFKAIEKSLAHDKD